MRSSRQTTLRSHVSLKDVGVHSGAPVSLSLGPADADAGYVFIRTGLNGADREVRATHDAVIATDFATVLGDQDGPLVSTAEHVLAALRGMGVDNATIEVDGPEVPIVDGSAAPFVEAIEQAGIVSLAAPRRFIRVLKPVRVSIGEAWGELRPADHGFRAEIEIVFANRLIGHQAIALDVDAVSFRRDLARARTFGCMSDVARLWSQGYARGASLDNSVVYDETRVLNPDGLRFADEFVRHKALDAVGDLALAGLPLIGAYRSVRGGHKLNHAVLTALMSDPRAFAVVEEDAVPRRIRGHADVAAGQVAPAFSPEVA